MDTFGQINLVCHVELLLMVIVFALPWVHAQPLFAILVMGYLIACVYNYLLDAQPTL